MAQVSDYTGLITSEHQDKPNFMAVIAALAQPFVDISNLLQALPNDFDLDQAIGPQLDAVGVWVGFSRILPVPLTGVYFTWDDTAADGWDSGSWQGPYDPSTGLYSLPDDAYRSILRAKIAANSWDGTLESATAIWSLIFSGTQTLIVQDNQDMSMTLALQGTALTAVQQALLVGGYFPMKPEGVNVQFFGIPIDTGPLFAWDVTPGTVMAGWDTGEWVQELPGF